MEEGLIMIDAEVVRLRKLRNMALRVRALAEVLSTDRSGENRAIAMSKVISWRVVRVITGRLRAHPNLSYQNGPSRIRYGFNRAFAYLIGTTARFRRRGEPLYALHLQYLLRQLDDTRALTWEQELSDTLGRAQRQFRRLIQELAGVADSAAAPALPRIDPNSRLATSGRDRGAAIETDWPYLAI
jgi:hypothetical protein